MSHQLCQVSTLAPLVSEVGDVHCYPGLESGSALGLQGLQIECKAAKQNKNIVLSLNSKIAIDLFLHLFIYVPTVIIYVMTYSYTVYSFIHL